MELSDVTLAGAFEPLPRNEVIKAMGCRNPPRVLLVQARRWGKAC